MSRPIVLPQLPEPDLDGWERTDTQVIEYARAAVELDRRGIVVTDVDVRRAQIAADKNPLWGVAMRAALESFAARKRGEA